MPGPEFFQTRMGQKFYEYDVPRLAEALERLADQLETFNRIHSMVKIDEYGQIVPVVSDFWPPENNPTKKGGGD